MRDVKSFLFFPVFNLFLGFACFSQQQGKETPNIILILADDMGWADMGHDGSEIETPNLDRLAKEGMKLTNFYATESLHWETQHNMGVKKGKWKLVHHFYEEQPYLYNHETDPYEHENIADKHPDIVAALLATHEEWVLNNYPDPVPRQIKRSSYIFSEN